MQRIARTMICAFAFCCASIADAQQNKFNDVIEKNLLLEKKGQYREAYVEWQKLLINPEFGGKYLANPDVQKIFYSAYFHYTRTCYKMALNDPKIMNRQKFIDMAANMVIRMEFSKTKEGWEIFGPMFQEYYKTDKDADKLIETYESLKAKRLKGSSLRNPSRDRVDSWRAANLQLLEYRVPLQIARHPSKTHDSSRPDLLIRL